MILEGYRKKLCSATLSKTKKQTRKYNLDEDWRGLM
jgi:hypothetical protein